MNTSGIIGALTSSIEPAKGALPLRGSVSPPCEPRSRVAVRRVSPARASGVDDLMSQPADNDVANDGREAGAHESSKGRRIPKMREAARASRAASRAARRASRTGPTLLVVAAVAALVSVFGAAYVVITLLRAAPTLSQTETPPPAQLETKTQP
jgi:hypothetical protein